MARKVSGYLARDGRIYETEQEAELVDATAGLMEACERENIAPKKFLQAVDTLHEEIEDYLRLKYHFGSVGPIDSAPNEGWDNYGERTPQETSQDEAEPRARSTPFDPTNDGYGEEGTDPLLDEPLDSLEPVPNVRDGSQSTDLQSKQPRVALRSGLYYARSVQRHAVMAVGSITGLT